MPLHKIIEIIFTILMLLFLALMVIGIMTFITFIEQLNSFEVGFGMRLIFIAGMTCVFFYILKMVIDKIQDYNRHF